FIDHQGERLLLVDCSGCDPKQVAELSDRLAKFLDPHPDHSILLLADFTGTHFTREAIERIKIAAVYNRKHLKRSAWVFNSNLPKPVLESVQVFSQRDIPQFETREEAMKFLVSGS
ncbi:MAG: hypothetical protein ACXVZV_12495, partial [Terriglobales bacterium]